MWKMSKRLAVCIFAAAWWGIFYPELCFSEDTCAAVRTETVREENGATQSAQDYGQKQLSGGSQKIDAADVWRASGDEIVIRSRFWEWCEEHLIGTRENKAKSSAEME